MMSQENMLARYSVLHELGRGAIGAVYAARDRETGAVVALKRLDPALLSKSDANFAARFLKHARSAKLLKHRNIVTILDAGEVGGTVYVAMEMLEGQSLRGLLDAGPVPIARAVQIARDIACGLAHAHLQGVVHGGLKPSNVIVLRSGVVKVTDFGIGQLGQAALLSGARAGCLRYLSPEQVRGDPIDHRCDIFSLGALCYEMLTHRPPFADGSAKEIMENLRQAKPPRPSDLNQHVPRALDAIVLSMLAGEPAVRMPGAPILLRDLQRLEEGLGLGSGASAVTDEPAASVPPTRPEPGPQTPDDPRSVRIPGTSSAAEESPRRNRMPEREAFDYQKAMVMMERESRRTRPSGSRPGMLATALVLAVLGVGVAGFMHYSSGRSEPSIAVSRMQEAPATAPGAPEASSLPAVDDEQAEQESSGMLSASSPMPPKPPVADERSPVAQAESALAGASAPEPPPAIEPAAEVPEQQPAGTAQVIVAVSPRGEIYINGKHHGTTPPITTFALEPGMHRIEVRSGSRRPYLTYMTVQAGDVRRIRHDFDASRAVRPPKSASWRNSDRAAR